MAGSELGQCGAVWAWEQVSDGCMSGAWVLRTGLGSRLEMDSWTKRVWREDMVFL